MVRKIDFEDMDIAEDGSGDILCDGRFFSGIAFERDEEIGRLRALVGYWLAKRHGAARTWYPNGQLKSEEYCFQGFRNGPSRTWHDNGQLESDAYWECGVLIQMCRWDTTGTFLDTYDLTHESPDFVHLEKQRARREWFVVDIDLETWEFVERSQGWGR